MISRGIRNNNWGNIRHGNNWRGEVRGNDGGFESFENPIWGLRALIKTARSYYYKHKLTDVGSFVMRWAPPVDNNPHNDKYIKHILKSVDKEICIEEYEYMFNFIKALCEFEQGQKQLDAVWNDWYFDMAWKLV